MQHALKLLEKNESLSLRPYQREALDAIYEYFHENSGNPVVSIPTGGGKSLIIAQMLKESFGWWPDTRVLILTHLRELIAQNFAELLALWPDAPAGIHSAGLNHRDVWSPIIFGGIQSLHNRSHDLPRTDLVIIDEAHLVPCTASTMYRKFLRELGEINQNLKVVGLTATPYRLDSGMLHEGDDALFTDLVFDANVKSLIQDGYLLPPVSRVQATEIDTTNVGTRGGEFIAGSLEAAALDPQVIEHIAQEIVAAGGAQIPEALKRRIASAEELARRPGTEGERVAAQAAVERLRAGISPLGERKGWLVFACGVKHAEELCRALRNHGISVACAFGHTPKHERDEVIRKFKRRELRALVTVGILTTGFNARHVDMIACVRPTKSTGLWIQMVGRGLRLSPETGKADCLVLDFGGNLERHGPIDQPKVKIKKLGEGDAPQKICPQCGAECAISTRWCSTCLFTFPNPERKVNLHASNLAPLTSDTPEWVAVDSVSYRRHQKPGKPDSMLVVYHSGILSYREWICFEHVGYAREKAWAWWRKRAPAIMIPATITEALAQATHLAEPSEIQVRRTGKYFEVIGAKL